MEDRLVARNEDTAEKLRAVNEAEQEVYLTDSQKVEEID